MARRTSALKTALLASSTDDAPISLGAGDWSTQAWIDFARDVLIREGVEAVKIDRLARAAGVTRGGFYWRFKNREDLLNQLIKDWVRTNTQPMLRVLMGPGTADERLHALADLWVEEKEFRPDYDSAVRAWARNSPEVAKIVSAVDEQRLGALRHLFSDAGYSERESFVRARVTYFTQVGYYAMAIHETREERDSLLEDYVHIFFGDRTGRAPAKRRSNRSK